MGRRTGVTVTPLRQFSRPSTELGDLNRSLPIPVSEKGLKRESLRLDRHFYMLECRRRNSRTARRIELHPRLLNSPKQTFRTVDAPIILPLGGREWHRIYRCLIRAT